VHFIFVSICCRTATLGQTSWRKARNPVLGKPPYRVFLLPLTSTDTLSICCRLPSCVRQLLRPTALCADTNPSCRVAPRRSARTQRNSTLSTLLSMFWYKTKLPPSCSWRRPMPTRNGSCGAAQRRRDCAPCCYTNHCISFQIDTQYCIHIANGPETWGYS
jgi:hypothetical protein